MEEFHPIFDDIREGRFEAVQQRVLADPAVLEQRVVEELTPLMWAIAKKQSAMALWLIEHHGEHDVDTQIEDGATALHVACNFHQLPVVQALVAAGADAALLDSYGTTPR